MLLVYAAGAGAAPVASALAMSGATLTYLAVFLLGEAQAVPLTRCRPSWSCNR